MNARCVREPAETVGEFDGIHAKSQSADGCGGHLAAFVDMVEGADDPADDFDVSPKSNAMVLFNPVFDNGPNGWGSDRVGDRYQEFSPFHNVTKDDPLAIVFLGSANKLISVKTAHDFQATMKKAGIECEVMIFDGKPHGFFNHGKYGGKPYYENRCGGRQISR